MSTAMDEYRFFLPEVLPALVAMEIASRLHGHDLINLGYTCKFWYEIAKKNTIWKRLVRKRFGADTIERFNGDSSQTQDFKDLYFKLAANRKYVSKFSHIIHLNGHYLERVPDTESKCGEVVRLNTVCWLQLNDSFIGVLPGKYRLLWRMKLEDVYVSCNRIEFRAKPKEGCGTEVCSDWGDERFRRAERRHGTNRWFVADMGEFSVDVLCKVDVEIHGRIDYWCGGITWDTVELKPVNVKEPKFRKSYLNTGRCLMS